LKDLANGRSLTIEEALGREKDVPTGSGKG